jgi:hypothetical protein
VEHYTCHRFLNGLLSLYIFNITDYQICSDMALSCAVHVLSSGFLFSVYACVVGGVQFDFKLICMGHVVTKAGNRGFLGILPFSL